MKTLVVKSDFGDYRRGNEITDPQIVESILAGEQAMHVTVTDREPAAATETAPAEKPKKTSK